MAGPLINPPGVKASSLSLRRLLFAGGPWLFTFGCGPPAILRPGMGGSSGTRRKPWNGARAWSITERLDTELRRLQDEGWHTSEQASPKFEALLNDYRDASWRHDMQAFELVCYRTLKLAYADFRGQKRREERAQRDGQVARSDDAS